MGRNHPLYPVELQGRRRRWALCVTLPRSGAIEVNCIRQTWQFVAVLSALVVVAQLAERRDVAPEVAGSSPVDHPKWR